MHHQAKFRADRSNCCRHMAVFFNFLRWRRPPSWSYKSSKFIYRSDREGQYASPCQILCWSVELSRRYDRFSIFQDGGRPPSWICFTWIWKTLEEHLLVFVTLQTLVGIGAVVSILCQFCEFGLKMPIHAPFGCFWGFDPINETQYQSVSQEFHPLSRASISVTQLRERLLCL